MSSKRCLSLPRSGPRGSAESRLGSPAFVERPGHGAGCLELPIGWQVRTCKVQFRRQSPIQYTEEFERASTCFPIPRER